MISVVSDITLKLLKVKNKHAAPCPNVKVLLHKLKHSKSEKTKFVKDVNKNIFEELLWHWSLS